MLLWFGLSTCGSALLLAITNQTPVVATLAQDLGLTAGVVRHVAAETEPALDSTWLLLVLAPEALPAGVEPLVPARRVAWSDDFSNLLPVMRWELPEETPSAATMNRQIEDAYLLDPIR